MASAVRKQTPTEKAAIMEAWGDLVDPREFYFDDYGNPFGATTLAGMTPYGNARQHGDNAPFFRSEKELQTIRDQARLVAGINLTGVTILERLTDYVVSTGFETTVAPLNGAPKELADAALRVLDKFADLNNWHGDLDREIFARTRRDGESFLALYACDELTECRVVEPEYVMAPTNAREIEDAYGIDEPTCWKFGVATPEDDVQRVTGYHVQWNPAKPQDFSYFDAYGLEHFKVNVDRNIKRGLSDYYPALRRLNRSDALLTNIIESATAQAAVAWVEEHPEGTTKAAAESGRLAKADIVKTQYTPGGNSRSVFGQKMNPASILRPQPGKKYIPGPGTEFADQQLAVLQGAVRIVGARWGMPEHMISGDASNNNLASIIEAGTPFNRSVRHKQHVTAQKFRCVFWKVLRNAFNCGVFKRWVDTFEQLEWAIEINLEAPLLENEDKNQATERNSKLSQAGILSKDTWAAREGLDLAEEQAKGAESWDAKPSTVIGTTPGLLPHAPAGTGTDAPVDGPAPKVTPVAEAAESRPSWLRRFWSGY